jgi:opacity protein-like surface antigen
LQSPKRAAFRVSGGVFVARLKARRRSMGSLKYLMAAGAALAMTAGALPAGAADYRMGSSGPPPMLEEPAGIPAELGTGWYLRGDVGYVDYGKPREVVGYSVGFPFDSIKLEETVSVGGGIGYSFNGLFRADVTVDYRADARIKALSSGSNYVDGFSTDTLKLESTTALVNAYIDLGRWSGITPYIGAGVGVAHNLLHGYSSRVTCLTDLCRASFSGQSVPQPGGATEQPRLRVMAGAAFDIGASASRSTPATLPEHGRVADQARRQRFWDQAEAARRARGPVGLRYMID